MNRQTKLNLLVGAVTIGAAAVLLVGWETGAAFPGVLEVFCLIAVAFLLDQTSNRLRVEAAGSTSFVIHLASGLLFGSFWGGTVAGLSTALSQLARGIAPLKLVFNVSQRVLCVAAAVSVYKLFGGHLPPKYLVAQGSVPLADIQWDLWLFLVYAATYFAVNTLAVNVAVAISGARPFREVWNLNARGVLGYDIGLSLLAILFARFFLAAQQGQFFGLFGVLSLVVLVVVIRHIYGMYRKLQASGRELLDLMVKAIEARDPYTSGHSIRVATLAKAIAREVGMASAKVEEVYTAALLHDVGKIHEEFAPLLRKESRLTPEETALLQTHSIKSAELVGIISSFRGNVQDSVRSHHERWDGGGYPDGLAADAIPLGARIIMISDTTDAMTSDRPYRKKLGLDAVIAELQKHKAAQFDPQLVDVTVNSVAVRRVIANLQANPDAAAEKGALDGGSHRVRWKNAGTWKARQAF